MLNIFLSRAQVHITVIIINDASYKGAKIQYNIFWKMALEPAYV